MRINFIVIPLAVLAVPVLGSLFTNSGMEWYRTIRLPAWTPPGSVIGMVWTGIFILSAISLLVLFNGGHNGQALKPIIYVAILNGVLNVCWSLLFFRMHLIGLAAIEAALLGASVVWLMVLMAPLSRLAALLLAPYALWVAFATYLTTTIWQMNR